MRLSRGRGRTGWLWLGLALAVWFVGACFLGVIRGILKGARRRRH